MNEKLAELKPNVYVMSAQRLLDESGCTVRRWRTSLSGVAFCRAGDWGIESPPPTTELRYAIFAHEVGHQMLHRGSTKPRWLEEVEAWEFALDSFERMSLPMRGPAYERAKRGIDYAFRKAMRRGVPRTRFALHQDASWWMVELGLEHEPGFLC